MKTKDLFGKNYAVERFIHYKQRLNCSWTFEASQKGFSLLNYGNPCQQGKGCVSLRHSAIRFISSGFNSSVETILVIFHSLFPSTSLVLTQPIYSNCFILRLRRERLWSCGSRPKKVYLRPTSVPSFVPRRGGGFLRRRITNFKWFNSLFTLLTLWGRRGVASFYGRRGDHFEYSFTF